MCVWGGRRARRNGKEGRGQVLSDKSFLDALGSGWVGGREGEKDSDTPTPPEAPINIYTLGRKGWDTNPRRTDRHCGVCVSGVGSGECWSQLGAATASVRALPPSPQPSTLLGPGPRYPDSSPPPPLKLPRTLSPLLREEGGE